MIKRSGFNNVETASLFIEGDSMSKDSVKPAENKTAVQSLNPVIPAAGSFIFIGLGQLINKNYLKALVFFLVPVLFFVIEISTSNWGKYINILSGSADEYISSQTADYSLADEKKTNTVTEIKQSSDSLASLLGLGSDEEEVDWGSEEDLWASADDGTSTGYVETFYEYPNYSLSRSNEKFILRDFGGFFTRGAWGLITLGRVVIGDEYAGKYMTLYDKNSRWLIADNSTVLLGNGLITLVTIILGVLVWVLGIADAYQTRIALNTSGECEPFGVFIKRIWRDAYVYIILTPALVLILFFTLIPFLFTFLIAFTNYTYKIKLGAMLIEWSGFQAFSNAVVDPAWLSVFSQIFAWTVFWALMSSFTVYVLGFINALIVESPLVRGRKIWRMILVLPWAIPSLISLILFKNILNKDGLINQILFATNLMEPVSNFLYNIGLQGRPDQPIYWFDPVYNGNLAKFCVIMVNLWLGAPYHMMLIIGVLATIPRDLYEAANIDGATGVQRFKAITLPSVLAATIPSLIMTFAFNFNNFGAVYFLTGGGPVWDPTKVPESMRIIGSSMPGQTDILISWIYKLTFTQATEMFNLAAVYTIVIFLIIGGFSVYNMQRSKSFSEDE